MPCQGYEVNASWTRNGENFMADFYLIAKRALAEDEFRLFRFHFLLGADWRLCCRRLDIDRGTFFHTIYRIEEKLGREYRETRPYCLYPIDEYFGGTVRRAKVITMPGKPEPKRVLRPPVRKAA
jgi:hypothetical protein